LSSELRGVQKRQNLRGRPLPPRGVKSSPHLEQVLVSVAVSGKARPVAFGMRPVAGEGWKGRRNADLCAADFCRLAGQGLRLRKSPLRFVAVAGLEQGLADYQPSLAVFQQTGSCLIQWKPPRFGRKLPGISFPGLDLQVFLPATKGFGWDRPTQKTALRALPAVTVGAERDDVVEIEGVSAFRKSVALVGLDLLAAPALPTAVSISTLGHLSDLLPADLGGLAKERLRR
jgi:hypothetical protein